MAGGTAGRAYRERGRTRREVGMRSHAAAIAALVLSLAVPASAQEDDEPVPSQCLAVAQSLPEVIYANYTPAAAAQGGVPITYAGHSTFVTETPGGKRIATDCSRH